jgi:hypothetical protein
MEKVFCRSRRQEAFVKAVWTALIWFNADERKQGARDKVHVADKDRATDIASQIGGLDFSFIAVCTE